MTREELIEELNKIDGVEAESLRAGLIIISGTHFRFNYYLDGKLEYYYCAYEGCVLGRNRNPEQVLSVVKALVE